MVLRACSTSYHSRYALYIYASMFPIRHENLWVFNLTKKIKLVKKHTILTSYSIMGKFLASHNKSRHHQCNHQSKLAAFIQRFIAWENIFTKNSFCNHRRTDAFRYANKMCSLTIWCCRLKTSDPWFQRIEESSWFQDWEANPGKILPHTSHHNCCLELLRVPVWKHCSVMYDAVSNKRVNKRGCAISFEMSRYFM